MKPSLVISLHPVIKAILIMRRPLFIYRLPVTGMRLYIHLFAVIHCFQLQVVSAIFPAKCTRARENRLPSFCAPLASRLFEISRTHAQAHISLPPSPPPPPPPPRLTSTIANAKIIDLSRSIIVLANESFFRFTFAGTHLG